MLFLSVLAFGVFFLNLIVDVELCVTGIAIPNINVPGGPQSAASASGSDALAQQTAEKIINTLQYIPTGNYLDAADNAILPYINKALTSVFLGDQHAEKYVSETQGTIACPSDLNCDFSRPCRWRNGDTGYLKWYKGTGEAKKSTWTSYTLLSTQPSSPYLLLAGQVSSYQAIFISDPIASQSKDGVIAFKFWSTPMVALKVCIRAPGSDQMLGCSKDFSTTIDGQTANRNITIKGPLSNAFEIVFVGGPFLLKPGGMLFLDDITYNSSTCDDKFSIIGTTTDTISVGTNAETITKGTASPTESTTTESSSIQTSSDSTSSSTTSYINITTDGPITLSSNSPPEKLKSKSKETEKLSNKSPNDKDARTSAKPKTGANEKTESAEEIVTLDFLNKNLKSAFQGDLQANHYYTSDQTGLVAGPKDLSCTFDAPCRWRTVRDPMDLNFFLGTGEPSTQRLEAIMGTKTLPKSPFILTAGLPDNKGAWLVSDPIQRRSPTTTLKFKYWLTPTVHLRVCMSNDKLKTFYFCSEPITLSESKGLVEKTMKLSGTIRDKFQIVFEFSHFTFIQGGTGFLDDISYEDKNYPNST